MSKATRGHAATGRRARRGDERATLIPSGSTIAAVSKLCAGDHPAFGMWADRGDLKRELFRFSKQRGRSAGDIVRASLVRYMAAERFQALRGRTLPFAEAQGFVTDEDVFTTLG